MGLVTDVARTADPVWDGHRAARMGVALDAFTEMAKPLRRGEYRCRCDICNEPIWENDRYVIDKHPEVGDLAICRNCTGHEYDD